MSEPSTPLLQNAVGPDYVWYVVYTVSFADRQILAMLLSLIQQELRLKGVHLPWASAGMMLVSH